MKHRYILFLTLSLTCTSSANEQADKDEFVSQYTQIVKHIEDQNWAALAKFESSDIKCGFGPEDEGRGCIEKLMLRDLACKNKILDILYQGCHLKGNEQEALSCIAPPQSLNPNVLMPLAARVSLSFDSITDQAKIDYFVCWGD